MKTDKGISRMQALIAAVVVVAAAAATFVVIRSDIFGAEGSGLGEQFDYDLTELRKIDPNLIVYRRVRSIQTGFTHPRGIAAGASDRIYIAGDESIRVFAAEGKHPIREIPLDSPPYAIAVGPDGTIYVAMTDHVEVYDPDGKRTARWASLGDKARLVALAVAEHDLFAADAGNRVVLRFDTTGKLLTRIGEKDADRNIPGLVVPSPYMDVAVAPDGLLRVSNPGRRRVEAYTFDGDLEFSWGESGPAIDRFCGCCNPTNLAVLPDGSLVTAEKGLPRVKIYDPEGKFVSVVASPADFGKDAAGMDLAVDSKQRIWVLDPPNGRALVYEKIGDVERNDE